MSPDSHPSGCLFLVATPIGNLGDLSPRASETLKDCDFIACEDTRISAKLLNHLKIQKKLISYREENEKTKCVELATQIEAGQKIALLSDAGYPCISDPGFRLVRECHKKKPQSDSNPGPQRRPYRTGRFWITHPSIYIPWIFAQEICSGHENS